MSNDTDTTTEDEEHWTEDAYYSGDETKRFKIRMYLERELSLSPQEAKKTIDRFQEVGWIDFPEDEQNNKVKRGGKWVQITNQRLIRESVRFGILTGILGVILAVYSGGYGFLPIFVIGLCFLLYIKQTDLYHSSVSDSE